MMHPLSCNPTIREEFLSGQLDADARRSYEEHLDSCEACRRALENDSAHDEWWSDAREYLRGDPHLVSSASTSDFEQAIAATRVAGLDFLSPTDDPRMLGRLGGYEIAGVIGRGGMGIVLKGLDTSLNRYVALKVLAPHLAGSVHARRRFAREAQAAAAVVHENVIAIHAVAEVDDLPYLVMPYLRGTSLQRRLDEHGPLSVPEVLRVAMQSAAGLAAAHAQGLVHRDIKPANILLADSVERVKITDFGLARAADDASLTHSGIIAGTPQYMSPEQARGDAVDARSDLFSLGSVIYTMCTGHPPFRAESSYAVIRRICDDTPRPLREVAPETPEWLARIVEKLHEKDVSERFQSATELAQTLKQCLAHVQHDAEPLPAWLTSRPRRQTVRAGWMPTAAALGLIGLATALMWPWSAPPAEQDAAPPNQQATAPSHEPQTVPDSSAPETIWDDGVAAQIDQLSRDVILLDVLSQENMEDELSSETN